MENNIKLNKDNIIPHLSRVSIGNGTKNDYTYHYIDIEFKNGYKPRRVFLNADSLFIITFGLTLRFGQETPPSSSNKMPTLI